MGQAVAERTVFRKDENGKYETWEDVARRVSIGNASLSKTPEEKKREQKKLFEHIGKATLLMSGRHLQHGDESQPTRNQEVFTNCSTAAASFLLFYLLLNGSGVGRSYDDDMMLVNWDYAPNLKCVLSDTHADFDFSAHESVRDAKHKYGDGKDVMWFEVPDSREGWAKGLEIWENAAFEKIHKDKMLILDFSKVRPKGSPIGGMQKRPASGPVPLMDAFHKASSLKGSNLPPYKQAMYIDHYFAACVLFGGARRSARMSTKIWKDKTVLDYIQIKRPIEFYGKDFEEVIEYRKDNNPFGFLWSSNNSVMCDSEFWRLNSLKRTDDEYKSEIAQHARKVFKLLCECSYGDGTGEPGIINQDKLSQNLDGWEDLNRGDYVGSKKYQLNDDTQILMSKLAKRAKKKKNVMITNPCVVGETLILTKGGYKQIKDCVGQKIEIWNGKEWSPTKPFSTGLNPTITISFSDGSEIRCTPYHKFILHDGFYGISRTPKEKRIEAKDLIIGDKLFKFEMPVLMEGKRYDQIDAYSQGFYSGDGLTNHNQSFLYEPKFICEERLTGTFGGVIGNRKNWNPGKMLDKNFVPVDGEGEFCLQWLAGLIDSDGCVTKDKNGNGIQITSIDREFLLNVKLMLSRIGVCAKVVKGHPQRTKEIKGTEYDCKETFRLLVGNTDTYNLMKLGLKTERVFIEENLPQRDARQYVKVVNIVENEQAETFCVTEFKNHSVTFNGIVTGNCGEIALNMLGAYCVIADVVPFHADTLDEAEDAFRVATRALMRVNSMDSLYKKEVERTNRIGVGITGIHEFAWKFFNLGFRDLIDEEKSKDFWLSLNRFNLAVYDEAKKYAEEMGVTVPHTATTIKPAGTTSKLFGLTEGWHLPSMAYYLRWVQFRSDDPQIETYRGKGYPVRKLVQYEGTTIVGFPTAPMITTLGMGDKLVTAGEATPEEQYKWLQLGEKYWIDGIDENGNQKIHQYGNQISYTLKYKPDTVSFKEFCEMLKEYQSKIKCCSVMPQIDSVAFEYQPEEPVTKSRYEEITRAIQRGEKEDVDFAHVDCAGGACPIDFNKEK